MECPGMAKLDKFGRNLLTERNFPALRKTGSTAAKSQNHERMKNKILVPAALDYEKKGRFLHVLEWH
jgi:hypothetical protein